MPARPFGDSKVSQPGTVGAFLTQGFGRAVRVLEQESIFGGWNSAMSKVVADLGNGPRPMVLRSNLHESKRVVTTDLNTEWAVLSALTNQPVRVAPAAVIADLNGEHLGTPAMLTEFIDGASLQMTVLGGASMNNEALLDEFAALAARIHSVDVASLDAALNTPKDWQTYIDEGLARWRTVESDWLERDPVMRYLAAWLADHRPDPLPLSLVHGDFHTSNTMVTTDGTQLAIDWEFAHIGDPREDLGWAALYESVAPPQLVTGSEDRFCQTYRQHTGLTESDVNPAVLEWFSLFNLARVIAATIPASRAAVQGANDSPTLAMALVMGVAHHQHCLRVISNLESTL